MVRFTPATTAPVRLAVTVAPVTAAKPAACDLDHAAVYRTGNYGVIATPSPWNLPPHLRAAIAEKKGGNPARISIRNGSIVQGNGDSYSASAVFAMSTDGIRIDHITASVSGADSNILELTYTNGPVVTGCRLEGRQDRITERMRIFAAVKLGFAAGAVRVEDNAIAGPMHAGIVLTRRGTVNDPVRIVSNTIEHAALATDGYGIIVCNARHFEISRNVVRPVNGRGLMLDTFSRGVSEDGQVHDNVIEAREVPNLEYDANSLEAVAMTVRVFATGAVRNVTFTNNTFSSRTGVGGDWAAAGADLDHREQSPDGPLGAGVPGQHVPGRG